MGKKQYSTILLLLLLSLFLLTPDVKADNGPIYRVETQSLNVRTAPDKEADIIGKLTFGNRLVVFQEKHGWAQTYYNDEEAWVATQFLTEITTDDAPDVSADHHETVAINYDSVHLRTGPGTDHTIVGSTSQGDTFEVLETNGDWSNILLDNGSTAWVASWLTNDAGAQQQQATPQAQTSAINTEGALNGYNIVLDPGHGGSDPGSIAINGGKEKDFTLDVTQAVAEKLRDAGATVLLTRSDNSYVSLEDRVQISHSYWTDAFISLHYDAYPLSAVNGVSTHYYANNADAQLAQSIQDALNKHTDFKNRGIKNNPYYVLQKNNNLSVLVELGFLTNPNDLADIQSDSHPTNVANAITEGVIKYFSSN